jgi:hypothetical protein
MPDGWGYAAGEGAEAFSNALWPTLNYQVSRAQQQLQAGIEKEKLRLQQERAKLEAEATRVSIAQGNQALNQANYRLEKSQEKEKDIEELAKTLFPDAEQGPRKKEFYQKKKAGRLAVKLQPEKFVEELVGGDEAPKIKHFPTGKYGYTDESGRPVITGEIKGEPGKDTRREWEANLDALWEIEKIPEVERTPEQKFRHNALSNRVRSEAKKEDPLLVQGRVLRNLRELYDEMTWATMLDEDEAGLFKMVNNYGRRFVGEDWIPILTAEEMEEAMKAVELPRTKEEADARYGVKE